MLLSKTPTDEAALAATALDVKINVQSFIIICHHNVTVFFAQVPMIQIYNLAQSEDLHEAGNQ